MKNLMVLLLLVQHVLLLRLLQCPLIHVPTIHLLKLLTLLQQMQHSLQVTFCAWQQGSLFSTYLKNPVKKT